MRFLEKLKPLFEELCTCSDPAHVTHSTLPSLGSGLLQPIAATYAKSGYLGILLTKVSGPLLLCLWRSDDSFWVSLNLMVFMASVRTYVCTYLHYVVHTYIHIIIRTCIAIVRMYVYWLDICTLYEVFLCVMQARVARKTHLEMWLKH